MLVLVVGNVSCCWLLFVVVVVCSCFGVVVCVVCLVCVVVALRCCL